MNKDDAVARVFDIQTARGVFTNNLERFRNLNFRVVPLVYGDSREIPVSALIYRAATWYRTYTLPFADVGLFVGDVVRTDRHTSMALQLFIGARIGIKRGSIVMVTSEDSAAVLTDGQWETMGLKNGALAAKFHRKERPLTIQTRGGVMGIKG